MSAYYNEYDKGAAAWLRELISAKLIAPGEVDERSIIDVRADDLRGFTQCHFFAGIGVWSYALRRAGWDDARPIWTASLPCQPFSAAGKGEGHADERHLADVWLRLAVECRPAIAIGEQVEPAIGYGWLDALFIQLEQADYPFAAAVFPACSVGAPHIRSRLYWVATLVNATSSGSLGTINGSQCYARSLEEQPSRRMPSGPTGGMAHDVSDGLGRLEAARLHERWDGAVGDQSEAGDFNGPRRDDADRCGADGGMGDAFDERLQRGAGEQSIAGRQQMPIGRASDDAWSDAVWLPCRDGKWRPTGPGIHPLVVADAQGRGQRVRGGAPGDTGHAALGDPTGGQGPTESCFEQIFDGVTDGVGYLRDHRPPQAESGEAEIDFDPNNTSIARVMRLRGYGNALVAPAAQAFIEAAMECVA